MFVAFINFFNIRLVHGAHTTVPRGRDSAASLLKASSALLRTL
jgi:hypothetical protein